MIYDTGVDRTNFDSSGLSTGYEQSLLMTDIEGEILSLIKGQFEGIKDVDVSTLGANWQAQMLSQAESLKSRFVGAFKARQGQIMQGLQTSLTNGFSVGISTSKRELSAVGIDYPDKEYTLNDAKDGQNTILTAFNSIMQAEAQAISFALTAFVTGVGIIAGATSGKVAQVYDNTVVPELEKGLVGKVTKNGAHLELSSYVEGVTRETSQQALLMGESAVANAAGQYLVRISSHPSCCPKCQPYQGAILIDDVFADGKPDGVHELLSTAVGYGLFHWNCRHKKTIWIPGKTTEQAQHKQYDEKKVAKNYEIEQEQRALEREIRRLKRIATTSLDDNQSKRVQDSIADRQKQLNTLIEDSRNKGYDVYRQPHKEAAWFYNTKRNPYQLHSRADYDIILSQDYKQSLGELLKNEKLTEQTHFVIQKIMQHRSATSYEDIYFLDIETGEIAASTTDFDGVSKVIYNEETIKQLSKTDGKRYLSIHNHPGGKPPSVADLNQMIKNVKVDIGLAVGHDGALYYYTTPEREIPVDEYNDIINDASVRLLPNDFEYTVMTDHNHQVIVQNEALEILSIRYGFKYKMIQEVWHDKEYYKGRGK